MNVCAGRSLSLSRFTWSIMSLLLFSAKLFTKQCPRPTTHTRHQNQFFCSHLFGHSVFRSYQDEDNARELEKWKDGSYIKTKMALKLWDSI